MFVLMYVHVHRFNILFVTLDFSLKKIESLMFTQTQYVLLLLCCFFSSFSPIFFSLRFFYCSILSIRGQRHLFRYADVIFTSNFLHVLCICVGTIIKRCCSSYNVPIGANIWHFVFLSQSNIFWRILFWQTFVNCSLHPMPNPYFSLKI